GGVLLLDCRDHRLAELDDLLDGRLLGLLAQDRGRMRAHRADKWQSQRHGQKPRHEARDTATHQDFPFLAAPVSSDPITSCRKPWTSRLPANGMRRTSRVWPGSKRTAVPAAMSRRC